MIGAGLINALIQGAEGKLPPEGERQLAQAEAGRAQSWGTETPITLEQGPVPQAPGPPALPQGTPALSSGWVQGGERFSPPAFLAFNGNAPKGVKLGYRARQADTDFPLGKEDGEREGRTLGAQLWWQWLSLHHAIAMLLIIDKPGS